MLLWNLGDFLACHHYRSQKMPHVRDDPLIYPSHVGCRFDLGHAGWAQSQVEVKSTFDAALWQCLHHQFLPSA